MTENQGDKKPMDVVAEEKLKKWLCDVGLDEEQNSNEDNSGNGNEGLNA